MVKVYNCKYCNFQTQIKTNFKVHTDSLKHQDKAKDYIIKCEYCTNEIDNLELDLHYLTCANKILVDKIVLTRINDVTKVCKASLEAEYYTKLNKLSETHHEEIKKLLKRGENALNYQSREHKKELEKIKQYCKTELDIVKIELNNAKAETDKIKQQHKLEIIEVKQQYKIEMDSAKFEISNLKLEICGIKQEHKENIEQYKKEWDATHAKIYDVKDKQIEIIEQSKIFVTEAKEKELARMENVMKTCGKITEKSVDGICNALTFANSKFTSAPILTKICKFDFVDDYECVDELLHYHAENTMYVYIGDIIVNLYKKEKAGDQSFWNTDSSRLGYIIRQKVDTKILWGKDVNADRITNFVIMPIIEFLIECVDDRKDEVSKFIKKNSDCPKHSKMFERIIKKEAMCKNLIFTKSSLLDIKLSKNIIKYITPKFNISAQMSLTKI
jgi:hypothetical protein